MESRWRPPARRIPPLRLFLLLLLHPSSTAVEVLSKSKLERCVRVSESDQLQCHKKVVINLAVPSGSSGGEASIVAELVEVEENDTQKMQAIRSPPVITINKSAAYALYELTYIRVRICMPDQFNGENFFVASYAVRIYVILRERRRKMKERKEDEERKKVKGKNKKKNEGKKGTEKQKKRKKEGRKERERERKRKKRKKGREKKKKEKRKERKEGGRKERKDVAYKPEELYVKTRKCEPDAGAKVVKICERLRDQNGHVIENTQVVIVEISHLNIIIKF
ncbi:hypothetical protein COCNU_08G006430 [Cocos nucifera]|uniref:Generative cell specific-1/HAP2 domain-containing protein n=1 Tax=Cocos nucifera TaxID=13894 RepID=A0A8K0IIE2_COCNU|nr:hypothetical protein COCNU_08G006430 [Cocos nucifera]